MAERQFNRLTTKQADTKKAPGLYNDGNGLFLQIGKRGGKSWILRYRWDGRVREMGLGSYADVPLGKACTAAQAARDLIGAGRDPIEERRAAEETAR